MYLTSQFTLFSDFLFGFRHLNDSRLPDNFLGDALRTLDASKEHSIGTSYSEDAGIRLQTGTETQWVFYLWISCHLMKSIVRAYK